MKSTLNIIFVSCFVISGCGQTGPLTLPEKSLENSLVTQHGAELNVDWQRSTKLKKTSY